MFLVKQKDGQGRDASTFWQKNVYGLKVDSNEINTKGILFAKVCYVKRIITKRQKNN